MVYIAKGFLCKVYGFLRLFQLHHTYFIYDQFFFNNKLSAVLGLFFFFCAGDRQYRCLQPCRRIYFNGALRQTSYFQFSLPHPTSTRNIYYNFLYNLFLFGQSCLLPTESCLKWTGERCGDGTAWFSTALHIKFTSFDIQCKPNRNFFWWFNSYFLACCWKQNDGKVLSRKWRLITLTLNRKKIFKQSRTYFNYSRQYYHRKEKLLKVIKENCN